MAVLDIRQRSGYLFLAVIFGHILLISAQVNSRTGVPVLEAVTFGIFAEVQRGVSSGIMGVRRVWNGYVGLRGLKSENDILKRQLAHVVQHCRLKIASAATLSAIIDRQHRNSVARQDFIKEIAFAIAPGVRDALNSWSTVRIREQRHFAAVARNDVIGWHQQRAI